VAIARILRKGEELLLQGVRVMLDGCTEIFSTTCVEAKRAPVEGDPAPQSP